MSFGPSQFKIDGQMQRDSSGRMNDMDRTIAHDRQWHFYGGAPNPHYQFPGGGWPSPFPMGVAQPRAQMGYQGYYPPPYLGFSPQYQHPPSYTYQSHFTSINTSSPTQSRVEEGLGNMQQFDCGRHSQRTVTESAEQKNDLKETEPIRTRTATDRAQRRFSDPPKSTTTVQHTGIEGVRGRDGFITTTARPPEYSGILRCGLCGFVPKAPAISAKLKEHHYDHLEEDLKISRFVCSCGFATSSYNAQSDHTEKKRNVSAVEHKISDHASVFERLRLGLIDGKSSLEYRKQVAEVDYTTDTVCGVDFSAARQNVLTNSVAPAWQNKNRVGAGKSNRRSHLNPKVDALKVSMNDNKRKKGNTKEASFSSDDDDDGVSRMDSNHKRTLVPSSASSSMTTSVSRRYPSRNSNEASNQRKETSVVAQKSSSTRDTLKGVKCRLCGCSFSAALSLRRHQYAYHLGVVRQKYRYKCTSCDKETGCHATFHLHRRMKRHRMKDRVDEIQADFDEMLKSAPLPKDKEYEGNPKRVQCRRIGNGLPQGDVVISGPRRPLSMSESDDCE